MNTYNFVVGSGLDDHRMLNQSQQQPDFGRGQSEQLPDAFILQVSGTSVRTRGTSDINVAVSVVAK